MSFPQTLRDVQLIHSTRVPLLALHRYDLALDEPTLALAREELLGPAAEPTGTQPFRSGFLLGVEADPATTPLACDWPPTSTPACWPRSRRRRASRSHSPSSSWR